MTFFDAVVRFEAEFMVNQKLHTRRTMESEIGRRIAPTFGKMILEEIGPEHVNLAISRWKAAGLAPKTIRNLVGTLSLIRRHFGLPQFTKGTISFPKNHGVVDDQPCFTPAEMSAIVNEAKTPTEQALYALLASTGLRIGEALGLHVSDVDLEKKIIHVRRSLFNDIEQTPKTKNGIRWMPIDNGLLRILKEYIKRRKNGYLFVDKNGKTFTQPHLLVYSLHPILEKLGIPKCGFHAFRHGRVSFLVQNNVPVTLIEQFIGHGSAAMIKLYTHLSPDYAARHLPPSILGGD